MAPGAVLPSFNTPPFPNLDGDAVLAIHAVTGKLWVGSLNTIAEYDTPLKAIQFEIIDLAGNDLGMASADRLWIDVNGAGRGWHIDTRVTPDAPTINNRDGSDSATNASADASVDLFTMLLHEFGHVLGLNHEDDPMALMAETLRSGERRSLSPADVDAIFLRRAIVRPALNIEVVVDIRLHPAFGLLI